MRSVSFVTRVMVVASALATVTMLAAAAGCSSSNSITQPEGEEAGSDGGRHDADAKTPETPETGCEGESTAAGVVGSLCQDDSDCQDPCGTTQTICSKGAFGSDPSKTNDLFGNPVCIQPECTQGSGGQVADLLCDDGAGLCVPSSSTSTSGTCFGACLIEASGVSADTPCAGNNKCAAMYLGSDTTGAPLAIGFCSWACQSDADCKSSGQKCQVETGTCLNAASVVAFSKTLGQSCNKPTANAADECDCNYPTSASTSGICGHACITGPDGDTACNAAAAGYQCTALLLATGSNGPLFATNPTGIVGSCAKPCSTSDDCSGLGADGVVMTCQDFGGGKFCQFPPKN